MDRHLRPILLGRLFGVDLKMIKEYQKSKIIQPVNLARTKFYQIVEIPVNSDKQI